VNFSESNLSELVYFFDGKRKILLDGVSSISAAESAFLYPVLCYSPHFETLLSLEQTERRSFLDRVIYYMDKIHIEDIKAYNGLMMRKRKCLTSQKVDSKVIEAINERLKPLSIKISEKRKKLIERLNADLTKEPYYNKLVPDLLLGYTISELKDTKQEIAAKKILYGCHRDRVYVKSGKNVNEKFMSFGQKKSAILFILQVTAKHIEQFRKSGIILLLDDFEAGLDSNKIDLLGTQFLNDSEYVRQIILTGLTRLNDNFARSIYRL
jgi:DNA replication and repair protein RecF